MTAAELAQLLAGAGLFVAVVALVMILYLNRSMRAVQRNQRVIFGNRGETDLLGHVADLDQQVDHLRMALEDLAVTAKDHEVRIDGCLARTGMVRFDAYDDLGGRQSTTICFLDQNQNGVILTTVVSREFARMYVKQITAGQPDVQLAPEETEAFDAARAEGPAPFTVRPRLEKLREDRGIEYAEEPETEAEGENQDEENEEAEARALERENRRRMRRGLPPLDALPPAPSTRGWGPPLARQVVDLDETGDATDGADAESLDWDAAPEATDTPEGSADNRDEPYAERDEAGNPEGSRRTGGSSTTPANAAERAAVADRAAERMAEVERMAEAEAEDRRGHDIDDTIDFEWEPVPRPRRRRRPDRNGSGEENS